MIYSALFILVALFLFSIQEISSQAQVNLSDVNAVLNIIEFRPISSLNLSRGNLAPLTINTYNDRIEYTFELEHKENDFSLNYIFVTPGTSIHNAADLLASVPGADAVSAYDERTGGTQGYIAVRGGRGRNFPVRPFRVYEVSVMSDVNWTFILDR
mgnify:CR=1 FL=1